MTITAKDLGRLAMELENSPCIRELRRQLYEQAVENYKLWSRAFEKPAPPKRIQGYHV